MNDSFHQMVFRILVEHYWPSTRTVQQDYTDCFSLQTLLDNFEADCLLLDEVIEHNKASFLLWLAADKLDSLLLEHKLEALLSPYPSIRRRAHELVNNARPSSF